jgi:RecA-family ATPase
MMKASELAEALKAKPRAGGKGWRAKCPAHDDHDPSLDIDEGDDGRALFVCRAGCTQDSVISALEARGLWQQRKPNGGNGQHQQIVAQYRYTDENESLLFEVVRFSPKKFVQRRPDENGRWIWNRKGVREVPYRLPDLMEAIAQERIIMITEGEKDADNLTNLGIPATTNAMGAGKWREELNEHFRGADVVVLPDNDDAGRAHADAVARSLNGVASRVRILELPNLPPKGDVTDWLEAGGTSQELYRLVDERAYTHEPEERKEPATLGELINLDDPTPLVPEQNPERNALKPLPFVNMTSWDSTAPPDREWAVRNRIPIRQVTLISGEGAVGKSIVALQLASAHVLGRDWLGSLPEPGPAIYLGAEDEKDELHRRLAAICAHYQVKFSDLIGGLHLLSRVEDDALLGVPNRYGQIIPTPLYAQLFEAARDIQPKHIGLDTLADVFGGNEIDRVQVRQFIAMLRKLAIAANGSVVLLSHPSLTGISTGTGLSGSTAWHNSVRARIYMTSVDGSDEDLRELQFLKNQYGKKDNRVLVRYQNGVFVPDGGKSTIQRAAEDAKVDQAFLHCLDVKTAQGVPVSSRPSRSGAAQVFAQMPEANGIKVKAFAEAQERLLSAGKIKVEPFGPPSHDKTRIVRKNV